MNQASIVELFVVASRPAYYSARQLNLPEVVDNLASLSSSTSSVSFVRLDSVRGYHVSRMKLFASCHSLSSSTLGTRAALPFIATQPMTF
jgi:hypothetical protein